MERVFRYQDKSSGLVGVLDFIPVSHRGLHWLVQKLWNEFEDTFYETLDNAKNFFADLYPPPKVS